MIILCVQVRCERSICTCDTIKNNVKKKKKEEEKELSVMQSREVCVLRKREIIMI